MSGHTYKEDDDNSCTSGHTYKEEDDNYCFFTIICHTYINEDTLIHVSNFSSKSIHEAISP